MSIEQGIINRRIVYSVMDDDWVDIYKVANIVGLCSESVRKHLNRLTEQGLVERKRGYPNYNGHGPLPMPRSFYRKVRQ